MVSIMVCAQTAMELVCSPQIADMVYIVSKIKALAYLHGISGFISLEDLWEQSFLQHIMA